MATTLERLEILIKGSSAEAITRLQQITAKDQPVEVIIAALRIYEWILAQQTQGHIIAAVSRNGTVEIKQELVDYIKDKGGASDFFKGRDIVEP